MYDFEYERKDDDRDEELAEEVAERSKRKMKARKREEKVLWYGLGMFGLIGWSVSVPTLVCLAIGIWLDSVYQTDYSWTLMLLILGISVGCINAWYWISKESGHE